VADPPPPPSPGSPPRTRLWIACGFLVVALLGAAAAVRPGLTWDEPTYVAAGYAYTEWLADPSTDQAAIDRFWLTNSEHPPAAKIVYGLFARLGIGLGFDEFIAARWGAVLMFTALVALVYGFTKARFGRAPGVLAAVSLVLMPRVFGHGHLAALDVPVALACFATAAAFARALALPDGPRRLAWSVGASVLWGVALLTKLNAAFLPVAIVPWALWAHRRRAWGPCVRLVVYGVFVFVIGWPWLWHYTGERLWAYVTNKTERIGVAETAARPSGPTAVPVHYLGRTYRKTPVPWHYPLVMTLVTVPVGVLVFTGLGTPKAMGSRAVRRTGVLVLAAGLLPLAVVALPGVPKYDGVRLFMPTFPFLACVAGAGAGAVWERRGRVGRAVVLVMLGLHAAALLWTHPYELSYYNGLVGGAPGARALGFETTYWGDTVNRDVIDWLNRRAAEHDSARPATVGCLPDYQPYLEHFPGMSKRLHWTTGWAKRRTTPDYLIVFPRRGYGSAWTRELLSGRKPARCWTYLGVPQCSAYRLDSAVR
jgi:4-amino-4-deoxy-L-arabinose transferase-like glycosyltransferase